MKKRYKIFSFLLSALIAMSGIAGTFVSAAESTAAEVTNEVVTADPEFVPGGYKLIVEGFDWGPAVSKVVLYFEEGISGVRAEDFTVSAKRNGALWGATEGNRTVTDAYTSTPDGLPVSHAGPSNYVTLEMRVHPGEEIGSPFFYNFFAGGLNVWVDYTCTITYTTTGDIWNTKIGQKNLIAEEFEKGSVTYDDITLNYAAYTPEIDIEDGKAPLIIWLHGAGEGGTDPDVAILGNKVVNLVTDDIQEIFGGAYVLAPQAPTMWMDNGTGSYTTDGTSMYTEALMNLIETYVAGNPNVDTNRIYIGGCSNGGFMTMKMIITYPDYFAAAYPVCEAYQDSWITDNDIEAIKDIPIWFTHAAVDTTVRPAACTTPTYQRLLAAGADNVHFTLWDDVRDTTGLYLRDDGTPYIYNGHWSWLYTLNNECTLDYDKTPVTIDGQEVTIMEWLAAQRKADTLVGSFKWLVTAYDHGPGVNKIIMEFDENIANSDIEPDTFSVSVNGTERTVAGAYVSDAEGNQQTLPGNYVTIELAFNYTSVQFGNMFIGSYDGGPFNSNAWRDPYTHEITLNKPIGIYSELELTDKGRLTPESDKFDVDGRFTYDGITYSYASYAPKEDSKKNPLVIWLHGAGEGGSDPTIALYGNRVANLASDEIQAAYDGAYVLVPQSPTMWMDGYSGAGTQSIYTEGLMELIKKYVNSNPDIDTDRIYIGGCSNGGYMTLNMLFNYGDYFAAAYPICEAYQNAHITDAMIDSIKDIPIWFIHSKDDTVVPVNSYARPTYNRLVQAGAQNVHFSEYETVIDSFGNRLMGHFSWVYFLNNTSVCNVDDCTGNCEDLTTHQWLALQSKPGDKKFLEYTVNHADKLVADGALNTVIETVVNEFNTALSNAKAVLNNQGAKQEDIDAAADRLVNAIHLLEFKQADKSALNKLIAVAEKYEAEKASYIASTYANFEAALAEARAVVADGDLMDADVVSQAWENLSDAILRLRLIPDKSKLEALLANAASVKVSLYTVDSVANLFIATEAAKKVMDDEDAEQAEVTEAAANVDEAIKGLVLLNTSGTGSSGKQSAGTSNPKTGDNSPIGMVMIITAICGLAMLTLKKRSQ